MNIGPIADFWLKGQEEYVQISASALKVLMSFSRAYLCETAFSSIVTIKNNYRTRLILEPYFLPKRIKIVSDIAKLCNLSSALQTKLILFICLIVNKSEVTGY